MAFLRYLIASTLATLGSGSASAQLYQESLQERSSRRQTYEEFLVEEVRKFPEVKAKELQILRNSNNLLQAIYMIESDGLGTYTVKVLEDKEAKQQVLHLRYTIDSASGRVLNKDGKP